MPTHILLVGKKGHKTGLLTSYFTQKAEALGFFPTSFLFSTSNFFLLSFNLRLRCVLFPRIISSTSVLHFIFAHILGDLIPSIIISVYFLFSSLALCIISFFFLNPSKLSLNNLNFIAPCLNSRLTEKKCYRAYTNDTFLFFQNTHITQENQTD